MEGGSGGGRAYMCMCMFHTRNVPGERRGARASLAERNPSLKSPVQSMRPYISRPAGAGAHLACEARQRGVAPGGVSCAGGGWAAGRASQAVGLRREARGGRQGLDLRHAVGSAAGGGARAGCSRGLAAEVVLLQQRQLRLQRLQLAGLSGRESLRGGQGHQACPRSPNELGTASGTPSMPKATGERSVAMENGSVRHTCEVAESGEPPALTPVVGPRVLMVIGEPGVAAFRPAAEVTESPLEAVELMLLPVCWRVRHLLITAVRSSLRSGAAGLGPGCGARNIHRVMWLVQRAATEAGSGCGEAVGGVRHLAVNLYLYCLPGSRRLAAPSL
jgi:hypothetical protein